MAMINELYEIPAKAEECLRKNRNIHLPLDVPYLGMGSSYFAALALKYNGISIHPEIASEYYYYRYAKYYKESVLISQSGRSSETLWCADLFQSYTAIVNDATSPLANSAKAKQVIQLHAGAELFSASKSYINTLISLFCGHQIDVTPAVNQVKHNIETYNSWAKDVASAILSLMNAKNYKAIYIIGSGPNIATIHQATLLLTETARLPVIAVPIAQYDHGIKEAAETSIVIPLIVNSPLKERTFKLLEKISEYGAYVIPLESYELSEALTPITTIVPLNFLAYYLAKYMGIAQTFTIGDKITEVENE